MHAASCTTLVGSIVQHQTQETHVTATTAFNPHSCFYCVVCREVSELHTPYVFPQECGGRCSVRWLHLASPDKRHIGTCNARSSSLLVSTLNEAAFNMSVGPYSVDELACARRQSKLVPTLSHYVVHIDAAHMGVGGDDSWSPTVHSHFLVRPGKHTLTLLILAT
jgi:beta-galactosidase